MRFQPARNRIGSCALLLIFGVLFLNLTPLGLKGNITPESQFPRQIETIEALPMGAITYSSDATISADVNNTGDLIVNNCVVTIQNCIYNLSGFYFTLENNGKVVLINSTFIFYGVPHIELNNGAFTVNNSVVQGWGSWVDSNANITIIDSVFNMVLDWNANITIIDSVINRLIMNNLTRLENVTIGRLEARTDMQHLDLNDSIRVTEAYFSGHNYLSIEGLNASGKLLLYSGTYFISNSRCTSLRNDNEANSTFYQCTLGNLTLISANINFINCSWPAWDLDAWALGINAMDNVDFYNCSIPVAVKIYNVTFPTEFYFNSPAAFVEVGFYNISKNYQVRLYYRTVGTETWNYIEGFQDYSSGGWHILLFNTEMEIPWYAGDALLEIYFEYSDANGNVGRTSVWQFSAPKTPGQKVFFWAIVVGGAVAGLAVVIVVVRRHNRKKSKKKVPTPQSDDLFS
jgi:hypothetical protein